MEKIHGETHLHSRNGEVESQMTLSTGGGRRKREREDRFVEFTDRAGRLAGRVRESVEDGARTAASRFDERTGAITLVRDNPITALGIAFAAGFAIASLGERPERSWIVERGRRQLRTAILSGLTAVVARELRSIIGDEGIADFFQSFLEPHDDEDEA